MIRVNKKVRKFRNKSGRVLLRVFCVIVSGFFSCYCHCFLLVLLRTQRLFQSTHHLHKHEQLGTAPVFRSGHNHFCDRNILHCRLLGLINLPAFTFLWLLAILLMFSRAWPTHHLPKIYPLLLKEPVNIFSPYLSVIQNKINKMFINYHYAKTLIFRNKPYEKVGLNFEKKHKALKLSFRNSSVNLPYIPF